MDHDLLIDFNSPLKKSVNILDPLVPLPKIQTSIVNHEPVDAVGDNPFDNVFSQLCNEDDPFDMIEREAQKILQDQKSELEIEETASKEKNMCVHPFAGETLALSKNTLEFNKADDSHVASAFHQTSFRLEKSLSESNLSPVSGKIQDKFSKLFLSTQFDPQILDESSKCVDSGMQDVSLGSNSHCDASNQLVKSTQGSTFNLPNREEDIKAFVANRIEKCIEKAVTETRKSMNSSFRHRRSLSATSLHGGMGQSIINDLPISNNKPCSEIWLNSFTSKPRSLSNHDILSTLEAIKLKVAVGNMFDKSLTADKFNTGFRKSTASSSMYSSYGLLEKGFRRNTRTLSNSLKRSSSFSLSGTPGEDSVFTYSPLDLDRKSSDHILMEAKDLSFLLHRKAHSEGDEPMNCDDNFLANDKCEVELVDSDSSLSGEEMITDTKEEIEVKQLSSAQRNLRVNAQSNVHPMVSSEDSKRKTQANIARSQIQSVAHQAKNTPSPTLVPPLTGALSSNNSKELLFRPKGNSESRVARRGPMKAVIPVGNMVRSDPIKEPPVAMRGLQLRKFTSKSVSGVSTSGRIDSEGSQGSLVKKLSSVVPKKKNSLIQPVGRPVACSTPTVDSLPPRVSPEIGLQVSRISPSPPSEGNHRRSRSAGCRKDGETDSHLSSTPVRKVPRRIRSEDGRLKMKQKSLSLSSPNQEPVYTSTPLKAIPKNSPKVNRMRPSAVTSRKLMHHSEKENRQPLRQVRVPLVSSR